MLAGLLPRPRRANPGLRPEGAADNSPGRKPWVYPAQSIIAFGPEGAALESAAPSGRKPSQHSRSQSQGFRPGLLSAAPSGRRPGLLLRQHLQLQLLEPHFLRPAAVQLQPEHPAPRQLVVLEVVRADVPVDGDPHVPLVGLDRVVVPLARLHVLLAALAGQQLPAVLLVQLAPPA